MKFRLALLLTIGCSLCVASSAGAAENWPRWRGPHGDGVAPGAGYAVQWTKTENILWKAKLPGLGASTPIMWDDKIFVTGGQDGENYLMCLNRVDGKQKWLTKLGKERAGKNRKASGSNSSPVTDGKHIYVYFKSGDLACLDFAGKVVWKKNLQTLYGRDTLWWDLGTSPVLTQRLVVVACMQTGPSYLAGFDKLTGKVVWKSDRMLDAPSESAQSYTTPVVVTKGDKETIIVLGADHVTAHSADTGDEVWRVGGLNPSNNGFFRSISSPVVAEGLVVAPYARGGSLTAIKLGGKGDVTKSHVAWSNRGPAADVPTPVVHQGKVYICTDRGQVASLDLKTGKKLAELRLPGRRGTFTSSPVLAGGHLYLTNESGSTYTVKVGESLTLVSQNDLGDFAVASPIFGDGKIYLRTDGFVWCIGAKPASP